MIPERFQATCDFCRQPLDMRANGVHQFTEGWVEKRKAGGGHAISLAVRKPLYAHGPCIRAAVVVDEKQLVLW